MKLTKRMSLYRMQESWGWSDLLYVFTKQDWFFREMKQESHIVGDDLPLHLQYQLCLLQVHDAWQIQWQYHYNKHITSPQYSLKLYFQHAHNNRRWSCGSNSSKLYLLFHQYQQPSLLRHRCTNSKFHLNWSKQYNGLHWYLARDE